LTYDPNKKKAMMVRGKGGEALPPRYRSSSPKGKKTASLKKKSKSNGGT